MTHVATLLVGREERRTARSSTSSASCRPHSGTPAPRSVRIAGEAEEGTTQGRWAGDSPASRRASGDENDGFGPPRRSSGGSVRSPSCPLPVKRGDEQLPAVQPYCPFSRRRAENSSCRITARPCDCSAPTRRDLGRPVGKIGKPIRDVACDEPDQVCQFVCRQRPPFRDAVPVLDARATARRGRVLGVVEDVSEKGVCWPSRYGVSRPDRLGKSASRRAPAEQRDPCGGHDCAPSRRYRRARSDAGSVQGEAR